MSPLAPRLDTLGYVEHKNLQLIARCPRCGHETVMNLSKLGSKYNWRTSFEEIQPRLRCRNCGGRGATLTARAPKPPKTCPTCKRPM